ncbi:MAG: hypothetical protein ACFBSC_05345 [Microcoleaceae cyanobacterium]
MKTVLQQKPVEAQSANSTRSSTSQAATNGWENTNPFSEWSGNPFDPEDLESISAPVQASSTQFSDQAPDRSSESATAKPPGTQPIGNAQASEADFSATQAPSLSWRDFATPQMGLAIAVVLGCTYVLTRPCVVGQCRAITNAVQFNQKSEEILQTVASSKAPGLAKKQLDIAIKELKRVPFWSPYHPKARILLSDYQQDAQNLDATVDALRYAGTAVQQSQNPPHSAQEWDDIKSDWESAVANLEQVPTNSPVYPFVQQRLEQYRANLAEIQQRLTMERDAQQTLRTAKQAAQVAEARQGVARYADSWEQVYESWETATDTLTTIPNTTTAYEEAQVLLARYQPKLETARDRKTIESVGEDAYNRAISSADQAKVFEERGTWSDAVRYWSRAVNYAKRVPQTSSYSPQAKPLVDSYTEAWKQAEAQSKVAGQIEKAKQDLNKICSGSTKVCQHSITPELITVRLTPEYLGKIQQVAAGGNKRSEAEKHVQTLKVALESISDNAKIPVEVYKPDGEKIGVHVPK